MVFQVRKWGWKRLAAKLLLIPVLAGGAASVAHAQTSSPGLIPTLFGNSSGGAQPTTMPAAGTPADPKALLVEARRALGAGDYNRAQDLCKAAEAQNQGGRWGLFEDTPSSVMKDINAAISKARKAQSDQCYRQAKALLAKITSSEAEKVANLDQALQLAIKADQLHGPYNVWELTDRPDKLVKEIQAVHGHVQSAASSSMTGSPPATTPAGAMAGRPDARKQAVYQLMAEAKKLADQEMYVEARAKLTEAINLRVPFPEDGYSPEYALQELRLRGKAAIDRRVADAKNLMTRKEYAKAEAVLSGADEIAKGLGLADRDVFTVRTQLQRLKGGPDGTALVAGNVPGFVTRLPGVPSPSSQSSSSAVPFSTPSSEGSSRPGSIGQPSGSASARQLLDQADIELSRGDLDTAAKLAQQAHNLGAQDEARRLLNTIDAERLKLKKITAVMSLRHALEDFKAKDYNQALGVLVLIDPILLSAEEKAKRVELIASCKSALTASSGSLAVAGGTQPPALPTAPTDPPVSLSPGLNPPGTARVGSDPRAGADSVTVQMDALRQANVQKLRADGLKVENDARTAFGRGECDLAIQMLQDYKARVQAAGLDPATTTMLTRSTDSRIDLFLRLRSNQLAITQLDRDNKEKREFVRDNNGSADDQRREAVKKLFAQYRTLTREQKYIEAEKVALQAKQLDPDNPACTALAEMAKLQRAHADADKLKDDKERMFRLGLNGAEREGPYIDADDPVKFQLERSRNARNRGHGDTAYLKTYTQATYEIEFKLNKPIEIHFADTPLEQAVDNIRTLTGLPLEIDYAGLKQEGISPVTPVTLKGGVEVAAKNILAFTLEQAGLSYVIEHDMVKVTTPKKSKGRLYTKVFSVADLVTSVPNFSLPDYANFEKMIRTGTGNYGQKQFQIGNQSPISAAGGLNGGVQAGTLATMPGIGSGGGNGGNGRQGGTMQTNIGDTSNPLSWTTNIAGDGNKHEQLIKLITNMIRPYSWDGMGGPGRLEYYDIGNALVVNQTADVIQEVSDLLEALRRLQDLAIAVEVRIISLSESWFERMGVDFSVNILTGSPNQRSLQTQLTQVDGNTGAAGVFAPLPYINSIGNVGATVGLTPAGTFTPDLNVPITNSSFGMAVPPFGGYPNTPGADGGLSLGLAFLNEIQVYLFMEAAAGDRRVNVMQAPKLTLFNGQTASITVSNLQFFVTNVSVISVNGQVVFSPTNTPFPGPGDPFGLNGQQPGQLSVTIQGVVSADRRFVRLNMPISMAAQTGTTVPLFPITTFVTPVFEGGSQGQPIPFTQFLQQPAFTDLTINTTVVCPDGGTVVLGGFKQLSEGRNEFGPPFLSDIPYLSRLFKNVGIGRETTHIMIMVTPRIIINSEEEIRQTEGQPGP